MATTADLANFALAVEYDDLTEEVREGAKKRILDSVGTVVGAIDQTPPEIVRATVCEASPDGPCRLWGTEQHASSSEATMYDTALTRYLDFMDSFLAPGDLPHPSDNVAAILC